MRSSSKTNQKQTTSNTSNQINLEDIGGSAIVGNGNNVSYSDFGAIEIGGNVAMRSLQSVDNIVDDSYSLVGGALNKAVDSVNSTVDKSYQLVGGAFNSANELSKNALSDSLGFASDNVDDVLTFAGGAQIEANSIAREAMMDAENARREASIAQQDALNTVAANVDKTIAGNNAARESAFMFGGGVVDSSIDAIADNAERTQALLTNFAGQTIQTAVQSTKSESAQAVDKIIDLTGNTQKQLIYGVVGTIALVVFFSSRS